MNDRTIVIIGSGLAGYTLAREIRKLDRDTAITMVSQDHGAVYSKPKLSTALADKKTPEALVMKAASQMADELGMRVLPNWAVTGIDRESKSILLEGGERLAYRDLVLALGADPIRLHMAGNAVSQVLSVNDLDDYRHFRQRLERSSSVVILGAGLIGCEFANDMAAQGIQVTVIDPQGWPMARLLPEQPGCFLQARLEAAGVRFFLDNSVECIDQVSGKPSQLTLKNGDVMAADVVLSAVGLRPRTQLAEDAGLRVNRGIVVDRYLATSDPHVYGLGDCIQLADFCLPYVMPIMRQARALAATLCGTATQVVYPAMPIVVKTPACPTVVCPAPASENGEWATTLSEQGCESLLQDAQGRTIGFALLGQETSRWQKLAATLPDWLA
ncbi:NAD(P)/FAD-dependent oxidoreductase [Noviherbaspirillum sp.]|uniref:NAD(P)/FAD-dependent oxidoreductase n=1 Tax=Noviherbaspirillum sp. TaxID=1926288 RepID=UPI002B4825AD|nr:FAD-dependent oxidoreductase [Noviherbaspirillum sp.]HJV79992.1 FAD-dependent oxidoreductase [Noviherbaspirillum sp.]